MPREGVAVPVPNILGFIVFCRVIMDKKRRHKKTLASFGMQGFSLLVEEDGFEPSKSTTTDLQSAPFGHSGTPPYSLFVSSCQIEAQRSGFDLERRCSGGSELSCLHGSERSEACTDDGAGGRIRTPDLLITNQLLYQLSYTSVSDTIARPQRRLFYQMEGRLSTGNPGKAPTFLCVLKKFYKQRSCQIGDRRL